MSLAAAVTTMEQHWALFFVIIFTFSMTLSRNQNSLEISETQIFPTKITASVGEEVMIKLTPNRVNQTVCFVTTPNGTTNSTLKSISAKALAKARIQYWGSNLESGDCGVRISNISFEDEGYWRLTSMADDGRKVAGVTKVTVTELTSRNEELYQVATGSHQQIQFGPSNSRYCQVVIPGAVQQVQLLPGSCNISLQGATTRNSGRWTAMVGVQGHTQEIPAKISLSIQEERLDVGWEFTNTSGNTINVYCNLRSSNRTIRFCRFLRLSDQVGFHLSDGLGNGHYSYYGNGLLTGDCGMTIEQPAHDDYVLWQCILGVGPPVALLGAFVRLIHPSNTTANTGIRIFSEREVMAVLRSQLVLQCHAEASLAYCWFRHPNGTNLFPLDAHKWGAYAYIGVGLQLGDCGISLLNVSFTESGQWSCHMGIQTGHGEDLVAVTEVKITAKPLVAKQKVISTYGPTNITLLCISIPLGTSLKYCRFVRPDGHGFSVSQHMTRSIMDRHYYYGEGLDHGQCGVLVLGIQEQDFGQWTCAAQLEGEAQESSDVITVTFPAEHKNVVINVTSHVSITTTNTTNDSGEVTAAINVWSTVSDAVDEATEQISLEHSVRIIASNNSDPLPLTSTKVEAGVQRKPPPDGAAASAGIASALVVAVLVGVLWIVVYVCRRPRHASQQNEAPPEEMEMEVVNV